MNLPISSRPLTGRRYALHPSPPRTTPGVLVPCDGRREIAARVDELRARIAEHSAAERDIVGDEDMTESYGAIVFNARAELTRLQSDYFDVSERLEGR